LSRHDYVLGLTTEFCSEKIPRNRLGMASVILRKKVLIPRHSVVYGESITRLETEEKAMKKISFTKKSCSSKQNRQHVFVRDMLRNGIPRVCFYFFPRNGIPSIFLLCGTVPNRIPRVFCFPRNGSERNS
jgi:hypothetical protein